MVKHLTRYIIDARHTFGRYAVVGGIGFFVDMGTLLLFQEVFGILPYIAVILNQIFVIAYSFTANKYWTFHHTDLQRTQFVRYLWLFAFNYILAVKFMYIFNEHLGYDYRLVRIGTIALSVCWNFFLYRHWVFHIKEEPATDMLAEEK